MQLSRYRQQIWLRESSFWLSALIGVTDPLNIHEYPHWLMYTDPHLFVFALYRGQRVRALVDENRSTAGVCNARSVYRDLRPWSMYRGSQVVSYFLDFNVPLFHLRTVFAGVRIRRCTVIHVFAH